MNATNDSKMVKTLATGLILGGLALAGLGTAGCDKVRPDAIGVLASGPEVGSGADVVSVDKSFRLFRRILNHNETFLAS